ncbi:bifunctional DNA primase/polymerase [Microbacterium sp.]|uniref:bifunctional DNA primase/polymerase n=1 Tax=Microbacterium sp. TaxID=51671 RepID=UPI003A9589C2
MEFGECKQCGRSLVLSRRGARFCSPKCRVYWHRSVSRIPADLTSRHTWVRAAGKRPLTPGGRAASSTDAATWSTFAAVRSSEAGDGFGIMLGGGLGCYDLDHVTDVEAREFAASIPERIVFAERSMSGRGVHIFVEAPEARGWRRGNVERYTRARFIRMTGARFTL